MTLPLFVRFDLSKVSHTYFPNTNCPILVFLRVWYGTLDLFSFVNFVFGFDYFNLCDRVGQNGALTNSGIYSASLQKESQLITLVSSHRIVVFVAALRALFPYTC